MKTAMQVLITELKYVEEWPMMSGIIKRAEELLEKEKEQFDDMFEEGFESAYQHFVNGKDFVKFEEYYNQNYNQNK
jgi:trans-aconitate methyltransferase